MIHGTVSLVAVTFFLLENKQIKTSSLPSRQQTFSQSTNSDNDKESLLSLKPPSNLALLYNQFNNTSPEKTVTLKILLTPNSMTLTKFKLYNFLTDTNLLLYSILMHAP